MDARDFSEFAGMLLLSHAITDSCGNLIQLPITRMRLVLSTSLKPSLYYHSGNLVLITAVLPTMRPEFQARMALQVIISMRSRAGDGFGARRF
jgi:hypothetical protein